MFKRLRFLPAATLAAALAIAAPATAQDELTAATVVATVGETEITVGHMLAVRDGLPEQYQQLPDNALFDGILQQLIDQTLLAQTHSGDLSLRSELTLENDRRATIAGEVIGEFLASPVDDATLDEAYKARFAETDQSIEYHAAHILVATKEEADALIVKLGDGAVFADLAREHSTGPSGANGGDLGWFGAGVMVPSFFDAVAALEPENVSQPVQTDFGWHVIKLMETRAKAIPKLDEVRAELVSEIREKALDAQIEKAREMTPVDRSAADGIDPSIITNIGLLEN